MILQKGGVDILSSPIANNLQNMPITGWQAGMGKMYKNKLHRTFQNMIDTNESRLRTLTSNKITMLSKSAFLYCTDPT